MICVAVVVQCFMRRETWEQIKTAYASGIGLRELARNMKVPAGTVLARAKREGWTQQIAVAKLIERPQLAREIAKPDAINAISGMQSVVLCMQERGERHRERMAGVTEKVLPHLESMQPDSILDRVDDIEKYDRLARRNYGLSDNQAGSGSLDVRVLAGRGRTLIAIEQQPSETPVQDQP